MKSPNVQLEQSMSEVGFFDLDPFCDSPGFSGSWYNYPYFESGVIAAASINGGLFLLEPTGEAI